MKFKTTIILLIVFILVLGGVLLVEHKSKQAKGKKEKEEMLTDFQVSDVEKLQLTGPGQTSITIKKDEQDNWQIIEPLVAQADSYEVNSLLETLASLRIEHVVDSQPADLKEYGFTQKEIKIWLKEQNEPVVILTGMDSPLDGTLYARRGDESKVVLLPGYVKSSLDKNLFDLRNKQIIEFDPNEVQSIEFRSKEIAWKLAKKEDGWYLVSPVEALASSSRVDSMLYSISTIKAKDYLAEEKSPEDLKSYGLDQPEYSLRLVLADGREIILSLNKKDEKVMATSTHLAKIVEVDSQIISDISLKANELREKKIALFNSWEAFELTVKKSDRSFSVIKEKSAEKGPEEENWYLIGENGQKELADSSKVESFLRKLEYLEAIDFVDQPEASKNYGLDKPEYEITIKVQNEDNKGKSIHLLFGQKLEGKNQIVIRNSNFNYLFLIEANSIADWPAGTEGFKPFEITN
ncbi:MAG TPA: DUF4340 domain-containing protein [Candidatus Saccharicenans sp.]|jgi:hypothetical protein|nr:DUF4340 domain-containing protein [Candidatus Saccharicenans sp.]HRD02321.1 DUF4340 domain-containing protein [Candidatus Saccharicenans sp.]